MSKLADRRFHILTAMVVALATLTGARDAPAMMLGTVEMTCPYDGHRFTARVQLSGTVFDRGLDLRKRGAILSPSPLAVCPTNGFVFLDKDYSEEEFERLRPLILSDEYRALKDETPYYRVAWVLDRTGIPSTEVAWYLLQASWEAAGDPVRYARYASELLERLAKEVGETRDEERETFNLLIGELLRRLSRFEEAERHFRRIAKELPPDGDAAKIVTFQLALIAGKDATEHTVSEMWKGTGGQNKAPR
jgi:hypothetical protein